MNIVVVGAGAMGSVHGGSLKRAFPEWRVTLVDVWQEHVAAIKEHGLHIDRQGQIEVVRLEACLPEDAVQVIAGQADLIIVFTKTMHTESALEPVRALIGPKTVMMTLQNGLGNIEKLEAFVPADRIIAGITHSPGKLVGPGKIHMPGQGETRIMTASGARTPFLEEIARALTTAGLECHVAPDVLSVIWEKVAFNACMNGLTTITRLPVGGVGASQEGIDLSRTLVAETAAVAAKKGIRFDEERVWGTVLTAFAEHKQHMPSMFQDRLAKRKTEVDSIHGGIVKAGEEAGVPTPVTRVLYQLVRVIEQAYDWADLPL